MSKTFNEIQYINGQVGHHVRDGIYKVDKPFKVDRLQWVKNKENSGYAIIGTNYSKDYKLCEVVYFTNSSYGRLSNLVQELNKKNPEQYGYIQSLSDSKTEILGGYTVV